MGDMADMHLERLGFEDPAGMFPTPDMFKEKRMAVVKRKLPVASKKKMRVGRAPSGVNTPEVTLPTERSVPSSRLQDFITLLFGEKKIGKTDLTAQFPNTLHLMFEPGGKSQTIYQRPVNTWKEFQGYVKLLEKDKRFDNVTVDTADLQYAACMDFVMQRMGIEHPSEEAFGKGWAAVREEYILLTNIFNTRFDEILFIFK